MLSRLSRCSLVRRSTALPLPQLPYSPIRLAKPLERRCYNTEFRSRLTQEVRNGGIRRNLFPIITFTLFVATAIGGAAYYVYLYRKLVDEPLSVYPKEVAQQIKTALYYASRGDASKMTNCFREAIKLAEESGMHPLSDQIAGLKIECAALLAKLNDGKHMEKAIEILEHVLDESVGGAEYFQKEGRWADRTKVLMRAVLLGYKVGELYTASGKPKEAEEAMVWGTETLLREVRRRELEKIDPEKEGEWFTPVAFSGCLEKLATHYEKTNKHSLATPLFLRAVTLLPAKTCHTVTLMTNLAASLAQQSPPEGAKVTRDHLVQDGIKWVEKALEIDATITPPERTAECDEACVIATHNLGEMLEMLKKKKRAALKYVEAKSLAQGLGMPEAVRQAEEGLMRLERGGNDDQKPIVEEKKQETE